MLLLFVQPKTYFAKRKYQIKINHDVTERNIKQKYVTSKINCY